MLKDSIEQLASMSGCPAVEPEGVLIEVALQVLDFHTALVDRQQPALEKRDDQMDMREQPIRDARRGDAPFVAIPLRREGIIPQPAIRDHGAFGSDADLDEWDQAGGREIPDVLEAGAAEPTARDLHRHGDLRFLQCFSPFNAWFDSPNERVVHFHHAREGLPAGPHHGPAQFVEHEPRRAVAPQLQRLLEPRSASSALLGNHPPNGFEPHAQGDMAPMEDRASRHRDEGMASCAYQLRPDGLVPSGDVLAPGTPESFGPTQARQIGTTSVFRAEVRFKIQESSRIVVQERAYYPLGVVDSSA